MNKKGNIGQSGKGQGYSMLNTLNPFSSIMGGGDYVPDWAHNLFPGSQATGAMAFKMGAVGLLAAGLVGGYRAIQHFDALANLRDSEGPAKDLHSQIGTTFNLSMKNKPVEKTKQTKKANESSKGTDRAPIFSWNNTLGTALPIGAFLLASAGAYTLVDTWADKRRNARLDQAIKDKDAVIKDLMLARAKIPRARLNNYSMGQASGDAIEAGSYVKEASDGVVDKTLRTAVSAAGLLGIALFSAGAIGSYNYFKALDDGNQKYDAAKKGLKEYAKLKSGMTPITTIPRDAKEYFAEIDGPAPKPTAPKYSPQLIENDLSRPISVTL